MLELLDSINLQYPIGSLLAWETETEIASIASVGPVSLTSTERQNAYYLLDGHQRLSTIAGALVPPDARTVEGQEDSWKWNIFYNAESRSFEHLPLRVAPAAHQFPMSKTLDTYAFIEECQRVLAQDPDNGRMYVERIQKVVQVFQNYRIPVIQIRETGLTQAVDIFARLNSKGQAMTADQMVSALLYREDQPDSFDLADEITTILSQLQRRGFGDVARPLILRAFLAAIGEDIYRTDWTRIAVSRREEFLPKMQAAVPRLRASMEAALDFLEAEGVRAERLMPYGMQLIVLSSFFYAAPNPSVAQIEIMRRWFWVSSFSTWFGSANPSRVNALVRDVMDNVALSEDAPVFRTIDMNEASSPMPTSFDMRGARSRALLLVMMSLRPRDREGREIPNPEEVVQRVGPEALSYFVRNLGSAASNSSPANRIIQDDLSDRGQARGWLTIPDNDLRRLVWSSHGIPEGATEALFRGDWVEFLNLRTEELRRIEYDFMSMRGITLPSGAAALDLGADWDPSEN